MRALGLIGLMLALLVTGVLVKRQMSSTVAVPAVAVPAAQGGQVQVVPMHQAASQVQAEVGAVMQQQAQQLANVLGASAPADR